MLNVPHDGQLAPVRERRRQQVAPTVRRADVRELDSGPVSSAATARTGFEAAAPEASATAAADTPRDAGKLPQSGTVREEYANSGRWISQPGQQP